MVNGQTEEVPLNNDRREHKSNLRPTLTSRWDDEFLGNKRRFNLVEITPIVSIDGYSFASVKGDSSFGDTDRNCRGDSSQQYDEPSLSMIMLNQGGPTKAPSDTSSERELFLMNKRHMNHFVADRSRPKKAFVLEDQAFRNRVETHREDRRTRKSVEEKFPTETVDELNFDNITEQDLKILIENTPKKARLVYVNEDEKKRPSHIITQGYALPNDKNLTDPEIREPKPPESQQYFDLNPPEYKRFEASETAASTEQPLWHQAERLVNDERMVKMVKDKLSWMLQLGKRSKLTIHDIEQVFDEHEQNLGNIFLRAPRLVPLMHMYGQKRYFRVCCSLRGRTFPWQMMLILLCWVWCLYFTHSYGMGEISAFDWRLDGWMYKVLGISVGFLLKQHALCANQRWMEARKVWEDIIDNTRSLIVFLACSSDSPKMMREAVTHILGCPICIKNYLLGTDDSKWKAELMMVLPISSCERIMQIRRRTRAVFCLYACQRVIEVMVKHRLILRPMVRDINPRIFKLAKYAGACSKIRWTRVPYQYIVHIRFVLMMYMMFFPLLLMGISEMTWTLLTFYLLLISYAFAGLESMATSILNPFGESQSHLPLDLYCYLNIADSRFILGKDLLQRRNFVHTFENDALPLLTHRLTIRSGASEHKVSRAMFLS